VKVSNPKKVGTSDGQFLARHSAETLTLNPRCTPNSIHVLQRRHPARLRRFSKLHRAGGHKERVAISREVTDAYPLHCGRGVRLPSFWNTSTSGRSCIWCISSRPTRFRTKVS